MRGLSRFATVVLGGELRGIRKEKTMFATKKIVLSAAIILSTAFALATSAAFANAPGGAYIQCDGSKSSPVRCTPDSW
jgi:hypothetical protein